MVHIYPLSLLVFLKLEKHAFLRRKRGEDDRRRQRDYKYNHSEEIA